MADGFWQDEESLGSGREADLPRCFCSLSDLRCRWSSARTAEGDSASTLRPLQIISINNHHGNVMKTERRSALASVYRVALSLLDTCDWLASHDAT